MFTKFRNLSENAQRLLCLYAYSGTGSQKSLKEFKSLLSEYFSDFDAISEDAETELINNNMFVRKGFSFYSNQYNFALPDHILVPALWYTFEERKDLSEEFHNMHLSFGTHLQYLRNAVLQLVNSDYTTCSAALYLKPNDIRYFTSVCITRQFIPLFQGMSRETFEVFYIRTISDLIENDIIVDTQYLEELSQGNKSLSIPQILSLKGYTELYAYIAHGTIPNHDFKSSDVGGLTLVGIHRVLEGKYAEAIKIFAMAMKTKNKNSDIKNMYLVSLLNHYLFVAYAHDGSAESQNKMRQFLNKSNISEVRTYVPARIIAEQTLATNKEWHAEGVRGILERAELNIVPRTLAFLTFLIDKYYDLKVTNSELPPTFQMPRLALLRHELSEYLDLSDKERDHLKTLYGTHPGLTGVPHKPSWMVALESLMTFGDNNAVQKEKSTRLMYLINGARGNIEVREQSRLKNGNWGSGKAVSYNRLAVSDMDCMNEADRRIMRRYRSKSYYEIQLEDIVEEMTEESRLYTGYYAPYQLVKVTEDKPYIVIDRVGNNFVVSSNIPKYRLHDEIIITKRTDEEITFVKIPNNQRIAFEKFLHVGTFPLNAEPLLRSVLSQIGAQVEIHSELIPNGSTLPTIKGSGMACVQINPSSEGYHTITISAHPISDGHIYQTLGKGDTKYIDEHEGRRVWVERDMQGEKEVRKIFEDFFKEQEDCLDTDYHDAEVMLDAESKLDLDPYETLYILELIQDHPDIMYAEWPEGKKARIRKLEKGTADWSGTLHEKGMWFQLEGEIKVDENTVLSMSQLLELVGSGKGRYIKLGDGEFLALSEKLQRQLRALESVANHEKGAIQISPFSAAFLADDVFNGDIRIFMSKNLVELRKRILDSANYKPEVPTELNATLRPYQIDGYQWMARLNSWGAGALLADDMGLGKTVQTIAFLLLKAKEGASLVVAPASVAPNWKVEFEKFAPSLHTIILNFADNRKEAIEQAGPNDVIITTYGILLTEQDNINARTWNVACLDEAHIIKNRGAKTSAAAMKIQADNRVILTGTPVQNHLSELWSLFQFINPGLLGKFEVFSRKFITQIERDKDKACQARLDNIVRPFMLRRTKNAVLKELPDKTEIYQKIVLSPEEMAVYEVIRQKAENLLSSQDKSLKIDFNVLAEITRLRQASCSASLVEPNWQGTSSKVTALIELIQGIIEGDNRALIFSQFTSFFDIVRVALSQADIPYFYIDGSIPIKKRTELVDEFQNPDGDKTPKIFLISLKAGGLGLNLTNANYVIHLDPWWNPAIEQQATDRAYRIGQKQAVTVYHLVSEGTIEEKIIRLHETKRDLAENILDGTDISHKLTGKDLLDMVSKR